VRLCFNYQHKKKNALVIYVDFEESLNKNGISNQVTALHQETTMTCKTPGKKSSDFSW